MNTSTVLYYLLLLVAFISGCLSVGRRTKIEYKALLLLIIVTIVIEVVQSIYISVHGHDLVLVYYIFSPVESAFYIYMYYQDTRAPVIRKIYKAMSALLAALIAFNLFIPLKFKIVELPLETCWFFDLVASCIFMIDVLMDKREGRENRPLLLTALGELMLCCGMTLLYGGVFVILKTCYNTLLLSFIFNLFLYAGITGTFLSLRRQQLRIKELEI